MLREWHLIGFLLSLFSPSQAQNSIDDARFNPDVEILGCDALSCAQNDNNTICYPIPNKDNEEHEAYGVAMLPSVLEISDNTSLSLTLVDGYPVSRSINSLEGYSQNTRALYLGVPQRPGCALMMQHQGATFPYAHKDSLYNMNSTICPAEFLLYNTTTDLVSSWIGDFDSGNSSLNSTNLNHCERLAQYMDYRAHTDTTTTSLGDYYTALITFAGGAISGPDVNTENAAQITTSLFGSTNPESCQPVQPRDYSLYDITSMSQILRDNSVDQNKTFGGRAGYTPVISILYSDDDDSDPDVQFYCVHVRATDGEELPYSKFTTSSEGSTARLEGFLLVVLVIVASAWVA